MRAMRALARSSACSVSTLSELPGLRNTPAVSVTVVGRGFACVVSGGPGVLQERRREPEPWRPRTVRGGHRRHVEEQAEHQQLLARLRRHFKHDLWTQHLRAARRGGR